MPNLTITQRQEAEYLYNQGKKRCTECDEVKSISEFGSLSMGWKGLQSKCKQCHCSYHRQWRSQNQEKSNAYSHKWKERNSDKVTESKRRYRLDNQEKIKKYYRVNKEKYIATGKTWCQKHRDKRRIYKANRRARKLEAPGTLTTEEEHHLYELYDHCLYCGTTEDLTLDHIVPLAEGGAHSIENCQILCRPCNSRKGTQTIDYR